MEGEETRELPISIWDTMGWAEDAYSMGELNVLLDGHLGDRFPLQTNGVSWRGLFFPRSSLQRAALPFTFFGLLLFLAVLLRSHSEAHRGDDARLQDEPHTRRCRAPGAGRSACQRCQGGRGVGGGAQVSALHARARWVDCQAEGGRAGAVACPRRARRGNQFTVTGRLRARSPHLCCAEQGGHHRPRLCRGSVKHVQLGQGRDHVRRGQRGLRRARQQRLSHEELQQRV